LARPLPDGLFSNQKSKFGSILEGIEMEHIGIFYGHLEYIMAIWYIIWPFGGILVYYFTRFGILYNEKYGNPGHKVQRCRLKNYFQF
jgi:hypothetical protein